MKLLQALCVNEFKGETFECGSIPLESCQRTGKSLVKKIERERGIERPRKLNGEWYIEKEREGKIDRERERERGEEKG